MSDAQSEELRAATRRQILAAYDLPADVLVGWEAIDRARDTAGPVRPDEEPAE